MNTKIPILFFAAWFVNISLHAQTRSDSLNTSANAILQVLAYNQNGDLLRLGAAVAIDSTGNAVTVYTLVKIGRASCRERV